MIQSKIVRCDSEEAATKDYATSSDINCTDTLGKLGPGLITGAADDDPSVCTARILNDNNNTILSMMNIFLKKLHL